MYITKQSTPFLGTHWKLPRQNICTQSWILHMCYSTGLNNPKDEILVLLLDNEYLPITSFISVNIIPE